MNYKYLVWKGGSRVGSITLILFAFFRLQDTDFFHSRLRRVSLRLRCSYGRTISGVSDRERRGGTYRARLIRRHLRDKLLWSGISYVPDGNVLQSRRLVFEILE